VIGGALTELTIALRDHGTIDESECCIDATFVRLAALCIQFKQF
jgi:hypothetical protein